MTQDELELKDKRIYLTSRHYITISFLGFLLITVSTAIYNFTSFLQIDPLKGEIQKVKKEADDERTLKVALQKELQETKEAYKKMLERSDNPVATEPGDDDTSIGGITFKWDYQHHKKFQKYILELRRISKKNNGDCSNKTFKINVVKPEQKLMNLPRGYLESGEYIWRIIPGYMQKNQEISQGKPSNYSSFTIYDSTADRIKITKTLRVGTSPSFKGFFTSIGPDGEIQGFDIDLINWIKLKLQDELKILGNIELIIKDLPWSELLPALVKRELDLVISAMTSTQGREEKNPGIKFTDGYYRSHQIFVSLKSEEKDQESQKLDVIKGKKVGVIKGTTNEQAANFLASRLRFIPDNSFQSQDEFNRRPAKQ